jgi:exopolysaccharide production protein ExoQ
MLTLAAILAFAAVIGLVVFDEITSLASKALWLPVIWLTLAGSRMLSEWLGVSGSDQAMQEGSPLDRNVLTIMLAIGVGVLIARRRRVRAVLRANWPIVLYSSYCALSIVWSDFPDIAFKRWFKALGDLVMVWLIVTDTRPIAALRRVLTRTGFFLIPSSFVLIYFLHRGVTYSPWGEPTYTGITTNKNMLGLDCMVFGLGYGWCFFRAWVDRGHRGRAQALMVNGALFAMAIWLLVKGSMMTCLVCLLLGSGIIALTNRFRFTRKPWLIHCLLALIAGVAVSAIFFNVGLVEKLGRDPTLTGRTEIWHDVLELAPNPYVGAGFESFWLGKRLEIIWSRHWWHPNEAHNGYLEVYLNLGWCGVALLALLMWSGYWNILKRLRRAPEIGSIAMAFFFVATIYSLTEAGFRMMDPIWVMFLWAVTIVPIEATKPARKIPEMAAIPDSPYHLVSSEASM